MIDGVKILCSNTNVAQWLNNENLDFKTLCSVSTGELSTTATAEYKGLNFRICTPSNVGLLLGSLHRYKNDGGANCDVFNYNQIQSVLTDLQDKFYINLDTAQTQNLEVGFNIPLSYSPDIVIKSAICYKGIPFATLRNARTDVGKYLEFEDYIIKLYNKSKQSKLKDNNILRFEIKCKRKRFLQKYGIVTLNDLTNKANYLALFSLLIDKLNNIIFYDFKFKGDGLNELNRLKYFNYSNVNYWANLDKNNLHKARKRYAVLSQKYNCINWVKFLSNLMFKICLKSLSLTPKKVLEILENTSQTEKMKMATFSTLEYTLDFVAIEYAKGRQNQSEKQKKITTKKLNKMTPKKTITKPKKLVKKLVNICPICGREFIHRKGKIYCSKKCNNVDTHKRENKRKKIIRAIATNRHLKVVYLYDYEKICEIMDAKEIDLQKKVMDLIISIDRFY